MNDHTCPVCGYDALELPPRNFSICACCGTEFDYDDRVVTHEELRKLWVARGCPWFDPDEPQPPGWNAYEQLRNAGFVSPTAPNVAVGASSIANEQPPIKIDSNISVHIGSETELQLV